jgi:hypothetical protein
LSALPTFAEARFTGQNCETIKIENLIVVILVGVAPQHGVLVDDREAFEHRRALESILRISFGRNWQI